MAEESSGGGILHRWFKPIIGGAVGLGSGVIAMYSTAIINKVAKPDQPVANFTVAAEGLMAHCQNQAVGDTGWWDFGDGTSLVPYDAAQTVVQHQYQKPGAYQVKLVIRNFLNEEHDRTVQVDVGAGNPQTLPPSVTDLKVDVIGSRSIAPATYRIHGAVKNAEKVLIDLGDKVEVLKEQGEGGVIDRLVVFEKPGIYPIQLIGQTGDTAVKQGQTVNVGKPAENSVSVILRVSDQGTRIERREHQVTVSMSAAKGSNVVERTTVAHPGHLVVSAEVAKSDDKLLRNVKAEVAPDRKSVKVSAEWIGPDPAKAVGGTTAHVSLKMVQEKQVPIQFDSSTTSATFAGNSVSLTLPPQMRSHDVVGLKRTMKLEIRQAGSDGISIPVLSEQDFKLPWTNTIKGPGFALIFNASQTGDQVVVGMQQVVTK